MRLFLMNVLQSQAHTFKEDFCLHVYDSVTMCSLCEMATWTSGATAMYKKKSSRYNLLVCAE